MVVMVMVLGCETEAGDAAMRFIAPGTIVLAALGRIAIGGAAEHEDVGVDTLDGESAEAGLDTELGES